MAEKKEHKDFIDALRGLKEAIDQATVTATKIKTVTAKMMQQQIEIMVEKYPELYAKGGSQRTWLERKAAEYGLDADYTPGLDDGEGPINQPNS